MDSDIIFQVAYKKVRIHVFFVANFVMQLKGGSRNRTIQLYSSSKMRFDVCSSICGSFVNI